MNIQEQLFSHLSLTLLVLELLSPQILVALTLYVSRRCPSAVS